MVILDLEALPSDPHVAAVGLFQRADHPTEGSYLSVRRPVTVSDAPFEIRRHAPHLGEHTTEVLLEAGLSHTDIQAVLAETRARNRTSG
jgi:crotonobetainyl-CoA:carnitine CoA-transferase CaiB-like acyl-CoA transferase